MKNRKKLMFLLMIVAGLFLLSGCTIPTDKATGQIIQITQDTTFKSIMDSESWFAAFFVFPLSKLINYLAPTIGVAGAIAAVTVGVNLILLVFTLKSNIQSQKIQTIQPELTKIQKKYEGKTDQASQMKQSQEMNDLYKKNGVNPLGAILPQFLQFPVIIAIYHAVQRASAVRTGAFLGMSLEMTPLAGLKAGQYGYIVLFVVMIVCQFGSMKIPQFLTEYKAKKLAESQQRKYVKTPQPGGNMMYYMMVVILVLAITWPAAMTVYWIISSLVTIGKTLLIQFVFMKDKTEKKELY